MPSKLIPFSFSLSISLHVSLTLSLISLSFCLLFINQFGFSILYGITFHNFICTWQFPFHQVFKIVSSHVYMVISLTVIKQPAARIWEMLREQILVIDHPQECLQILGRNCMTLTAVAKINILSCSFTAQHF